MLNVPVKGLKKVSKSYTSISPKNGEYLKQLKSKELKDQIQKADIMK
jgi:hypothetical protein